MDFQRLERYSNPSSTRRGLSFRCLVFLFAVSCLIFAGCKEDKAGGKTITDARSASVSQTEPPPSSPADASSENAPTQTGATGTVIDERTNAPIKNAIVTLNNQDVILTDQNGAFTLPVPLRHVGARAHGYTRTELNFETNPPAGPVELRLTPITPKALYLTVYGIGSKIIRNRALDLIDKTELNALVIDVKGDRGFIPYPSSIPLAASIGGQKIKLVKDIKGTVQSLKDRGVYTIARIVVFKDDLLGKARPELAIRKPDGSLFKDRENLVWVDASRKEVWDYNIDIAIEAAKNGFDEIQFDYVRFPDRKGLVFSVPNTEENRVKNIVGFLAEARKRLTPYNVFLAADIFGYVVWNQNDTHIGQKIDHLDSVDYICLMLYPSGFHLGIPKYRNPVANSNRIVYLSLKKAQERSGLPSVRFRPWLQAFRDYAFDRRIFNADEIEDQVKASAEFGSNGWMLWNPRNVYKADGLAKETDPKRIKTGDSPPKA